MRYESAGGCFVPEPSHGTKIFITSLLKEISMEHKLLEIIKALDVTVDIHLATSRKPLEEVKLELSVICL